MVDATENIVKTCVVISIVLCLLLDILVWVERKYAKLIFYLEVIFVILMSFIPFDYCGLNNIVQI